jgi:hypothetical protein
MQLQRARAGIAITGSCHQITVRRENTRGDQASASIAVPAIAQETSTRPLCQIGMSKYYLPDKQVGGYL